MNCEAVRERFSLLADDELSVEETLAVQAHLGSCEECGRAYREVRRLTEELRWLPKPEVPDHVGQRISAALDGADEARAAQGGRRKRTLWEAVSPYFAAAAVLTLAFAIGGMLRHPDSWSMTASRPAFGPERVVTAPVPSDDAAAELDEATDEATDPDMEAALREKAAMESVSQEIARLEAQAKADALDQALLGPTVALTPDETDPAAGSADADLPPVEPAPGSAPVHFGPGDSSADEPPSTPIARASSAISMRLLKLPARTIGATIDARVEITAPREINHAVVTASSEDGLVIDDPDGVLYEGPLRANDPTAIKLPIRATRAGTYAIDVRVDPGGGADPSVMTVNVPFRAAAPAPASATPAAPQGDNVTLGFQNTPLRQAAEDIGKWSKLEVRVEDAVADKRVTQDIEDTSGAAALKIVAEAVGCHAAYEDGVYVISGGASGSR